MIQFCSKLSKAVLFFLGYFVSSAYAENNNSPVEPVSLVNKPSMNDSLWQMALGLLLVLVLIFFLTWLMRKVTGIQGVKGHIKVLSAVNVGVKERAVLVEVGGEQLLLGVAAGQVNLLHKLENPIIDTTPDFSKTLKNATNKLAQKTSVESKD